MGYFTRLSSYTTTEATDLAAVGAVCYLVAFVTLFVTGALWAFCALVALGMMFAQSYLRDTLPVMMSVAFRGKWPAQPTSSFRSNREPF